MAPGGTVQIGAYSVTFLGTNHVEGPNFISDTGRFTIAGPGSTREATPERRVYRASGMPTTEAAIETYGFSQLYLQLGEQSTNGASIVRLWYKPFVTLIWLGCVVMAGAGFLSLTDRRQRVGAPRPSKIRVPAQ